MFGVRPPCAVGFDFDHTLGLDNGLETTAFYRLGAEMGHAISERDRPWSAFIADVLTRFRSGRLSLDEMVAGFALHLGREPGPHWAARYRELCFHLVDELVTPIEGARELLAVLAQRAIPTAILTNGWSPLQYLKIARALKYDGPVLVSDELGMLKPDPGAFAKLIEVLAVDRACIWFVGCAGCGSTGSTCRIRPTPPSRISGSPGWTNCSTCCQGRTFPRRTFASNSDGHA